MSSIYTWDITAASNANADSSIDWAEGMSPANVNDSARVMMARVKELVIDLGGSITATGTANVITVAAQSAFTTLANGRMVSFRAIANNTTAATLNVNSTGAKPVLKATGSGIVALSGREIQAAAMYTVQYSTALNSGNGAWLLLNPSDVGTPAGVTVDFAGSAIPDGWLVCQGQAVSRTTYADLFAVIGTTYGSASGTTFNVPDARGRVIAGADTSGSSILAGFFGSVARTLGGLLGAASHVLTIAQMPSHNHSGSTGLNGGHDTDISVRSDVSTGAGGSGAAYALSGPTSDTGVETIPDHLHTIPLQGGGDAHTNAQPTLIMNKIIKF